MANPFCRGGEGVALIEYRAVFLVILVQHIVGVQNKAEGLAQQGKTVAARDVTQILVVFVVNVIWYSKIHDGLR